MALITLDTLLARIRQYHKADDLDIVEKAYRYAMKKHEGQTRKSGEPYFTHPAQVAYILAEMELDPQSICAALLHDVVEDTDTTHEELAEEFGETITMLVDGVTKLNKIPYTSKEEQQIENLRKMFFAMARTSA